MVIRDVKFVRTLKRLTGLQVLLHMNRLNLIIIFAVLTNAYLF